MSSHKRRLDVIEAALKPDKPIVVWFTRDDGKLEARVNPGGLDLPALATRADLDTIEGVHIVVIYEAVANG